MLLASEARWCTRTRHRRWARSPRTWTTSASICSRWPATSSTHQKELARCTFAGAPSWRRWSLALATSAACAPAPRTWPRSWAWARRVSWLSKTSRSSPPGSGSFVTSCGNNCTSLVPGLHLNGHPTERLPNTLNVSFPGVSGNALLAAAPELAASTGSACHEGADAPSPVLLAMGMDRTLALGAVRLSVGRSTTGEQLGAAVQILLRAYREVAS